MKLEKIEYANQVFRAIKNTNTDVYNLTLVTQSGMHIAGDERINEKGSDIYPGMSAATFLSSKTLSTEINDTLCGTLIEFKKSKIYITVFKDTILLVLRVNYSMESADLQKLVKQIKKDLKKLH